jgi:hypothetical protein
MAFSYKCAVSQQSIPAYSVEPTEIVVLLPGPLGGSMRGYWDGYGHVLPAGVDPIQAAQNIQLYSTPEFHLQRRLSGLLGTDDPAELEPAIKIVKAKYYDPDKHTFASLPASKPCPAHGMFYKEVGSWNEPALRVPRPRKAPAGTDDAEQKWGG